jgi:ankyrin repeat protein
MFAARTGDLDIAKLLIERGADVNVLHSAEGTALVMAAAEGHEDLAIYLLEQGAEPNHTDDGKMTALHFALRDGLKVLHGISITNATQLCGLGGDQVRLRCKPLDQATPEELADMEKPVSRLFIVEDAGIEPLRGRNLHKLAEALLTHGADVNARMRNPPPRFRIYPSENSRFSTMGATPFFLAAAAQDVKAVDLLLKHGADPMIETEIDEYLLSMQLAPFDPENRIHTGVGDNQIIGTATPLMATVGVGRYNELYPEEEERGLYIAEKLLGFGADINATSVAGWTALHGAAFVGADKLVQFLVDNGADLNVQTGCGQTPLDFATGEKTLGLIDAPEFRESTVELLSTLGAKTDLPLNPTGECILGRGGRELAPDLELYQKIQALKKAKADLTSSR